jgi:protocatechuate 3,4-dioxygenase beta subunit
MRVVMSVLLMLASASVTQAEPLTGVVLRENGSPAAGAQVHAAAVFQSPPWRLSTTTDDKGVFRLDLPPVSGHVRYTLVARWQTQGAETWDAWEMNGKAVSMQGQKLPSQVLRLRTAGHLRGRLLQVEDDRPIAGASVFVDTGEVVQTDKQGVFEIAGLSMKAHNLIPAARGRIRQYVLFDTTSSPDSELELKLPRGAVVMGRVIDENGQAVPSAYFWLPASGTALTLNGWDETCAADGSFEYGGFIPGRLSYALQVGAPGFQSQALTKFDVKHATDVFEAIVQLHKAPATLPAKPGSAPAPSETESAAVELPRRTIAGVVRDAQGNAVKSATIRWGTFQWDGSVKSVTTNDAGRFALERVPQGKGAILAIADGFAPQFVPVEADGTRAEVSLSRGVTVRGVVVGTSGAPVARAQIISIVHCFETGFCNAIWLNDRAAETNDQGAFEIHAVPAVGVQFDILKEGFSDQRGVNLTLDGEVNEIKLAAGGAVNGRVIDHQEQPVRNFKIRVRIPRSIGRNEKAGGYYAGFDWYGITFTRNDGVFTLTDLGAHTWMRTIVTSPGIGRAVLDRVQSLPLDQLGDPTDLTIHLTPFEPLAVKVEEATSGKPVADVTVGLLEDEVRAGPGRPFNWGSDERGATRAGTNATGEARFEEPACEDGTIVVSAPGFARRRIAWTDGAAQVTVALEPEAWLEGRVRLKGKPLHEGSVRLRSSESDYLSIDLAETAGRYQFDRLAAGEYQLDVSGKNGQSIHSLKVSLEAGPALEENIDLD